MIERLPAFRPRLDWTYVLFIGSFHVGAVAALFFFSWPAFWIFFALYVITGMGITVGYHRMLTHRSFQSPKWLEYLAMTVGCLALEGGPIAWVAAHRLHHKESDKDLDPHNINVGFWHAHMGWIFKRDVAFEEKTKQLFAPDLLKDAYYRFLDRYPYVPSVVLGVALLALGGWSAFLWGFCARVVFTFHVTWFVNSAAHLWGYRHWPEEQATNNWWVALLSFGEGWHNAHHAHPTSARHGLRTWELDVSWIFIWTLSKLGLAKKIRLPAREELPWLHDERDEVALPA
jgi:stearoyl-CoA desaturase (delta-9 desaturase)